MEATRVKGTKKCNIMLYALSTCVWCKKTKALLDELGVEYNYVYVDLLEMEDMVEAKDTIKKMTNEITFPTIVFDEKSFIQGFQPEEIKNRLK